MLYRVSQQTMFRNINTNLGLLTWDMTTLSNQISTGKRVNKPSDDPSGGATIMAMRTVLADIEQYNTNVGVSDDWLQESESALQSMKLVVEQANVLAEQMSTDTYRPENMDVAAEEIDILFESLIKLGNTRVGDRYIFAGYGTQNRPFTNDLTVWDARADAGNATAFTGYVMTQGDREYDYRPDVAPESKKILVEITSAGGIDFATDDYSLARLTLDPAGDHNAVFLTADPGAYNGTAGNNIRIRYERPAGANQPLSIAVAGDDITVTLATDANADVTTTAQDVVDALNTTPATMNMVDASVPANNSGNGVIDIPVGFTGYQSLTGGYDSAALYRVSEDGGLTWSNPNLFTATSSRGDNQVYNPQIGFSNLATDFYGMGNDLYFNSKHFGSVGDDIQIRFVDDGPGTPLSVNVDPPDDGAAPPTQWMVTVHLETSAGGDVLSTANDVMSAINNHASASTLVNASLADYREGGNGLVSTMDLTNLSGGDNEYSALGYAGLKTEQVFLDPNPSPNVIFTAREHGAAGNDIQVEYVVPTVPQTTTTITNTAGPPDIVTVNLATNADGDITTTAQDVVDAVMADFMANSATSLVTASLDRPWEDGDGIVEAMSATSLTGGDDDITASDYSINIRFENDGSPLSLGDRFEVEVGNYDGGIEKIDINSNQGSRIGINVTGENALGEANAEDNILDMLSRLSFALRSHDTDMVAAELPYLDDALEKLTSQMARVGVRLTRNQFTYNVLAESELSSTTRMSNVEDADLADVVTALQTKQTAYQATLASTALVTRLSLVDYIS